MSKCTIVLFSFLTVPLFAQVAEIPAPDHISTVQFTGSTRQSQLPIIRLGDPVQLRFDDTNGTEANYYYRITHHDFDWAPSDLSKTEYLQGFDDVRIDSYENSLNTLQLYSHYQLDIPNRDTRALTKSGNYIITIYNSGGDPVFSRKFMIIEELVGVGVTIKRSRDFKFLQTKQVVQFNIKYAGLQVVNPKQTVHVLVMQNSNLKTAITNLKPQYTFGEELIYRYDQEAAFWAGNEFLSFDNKDVRAASNSVRRVFLKDVYENHLFTDRYRYDRPYTYNPDINGNFVVRNINAPDPTIEAEYVRMHFNLKYYGDIGNKEIHLYGNFNNWTIDGSTYMSYDEKSDSYTNARLFKQGYYDYKYVVVDRDGSVAEGAISGNYWQTENEYTVLVYFRDLGSRYDRIVGIGTGNSNNITDN
ncbi:MAG: DUF5103 domain-containing protein [Marinirhabdus sp.]